MTSLVSRKNSDAYKLDQRAGSLMKVPEGSCNTSVVSPANMSQKSYINFHSFRMNASLPASSTGFKHKGVASPNKGQFLQKITNSLPKISSNGFNTNHITAALSKKSPTSAKQSEYDLEAVSAGKKNVQGSYISQSQKSFLPFNNKSIPDIQFKLQSESSPANQLISSRSPAHSLMSMNSPKKTVVEEKLPLKRRALNKDVREAYRTVINSKEHGNFHDLAQKSFDKDTAPPSPNKNKNKKGLFIDHAKELEKREKEREEEKLADDIKTKGLGDFRRKIALYNFIRGNYLVEPESDIDFKVSAASGRKVVVTTKKADKDPKKDFLGSLGQNFNGHVQSRPHSRESSELMNSRRVEEKRVGEEVDEEEEMRKMGEQKKSADGFEEAKAKELELEQDLKRMQELGSLISARKTMNNGDQLVFKLVKDGNEEALGYLLARSSELVKAEDSTKQTPLHWAVKRGYYNIVVALCRHGADIYAADIADRKPIDMAERLKRTEILEFLKTVSKKKEHEGRFC